MSKQQQRAQSAHSKASRLTLKASGQAPEHRTKYGNNYLGQVTSGKRYWSDNSAVAGQQFEYSFDDIGNRRSTASGGDNAGANLRSASYTANNLNQYVTRDVPGYINVLGSANSNATVSLWTS